jgi:putative endonuclease
MLRLLERLMGVNRATGSGDRGEQIAAEWLRREKRLQIIARNWRNPKDRRDEIDLVCRDQETLVFVEVKARAAGALVPGYYAVNQRKKKILRRGVRAYLAQLKIKPATFRFDVVEVNFPQMNATPPVILHFENVPLFSKSFRP